MSIHALTHSIGIVFIVIVLQGAQGPDEWLPPTGQCGYVSRFVRTAKKYALSFTTFESRWVQDFLNRCR
jgi:hypothetical protein